MSSAIGGAEAVVLNASAALTIGGIKAYESINNTDLGRPFLALAFVNFATATSIGYHTFSDLKNVDEMITPLSLTAAYCFWGLRSVMLTHQQLKGKKPEGFKDDPHFYQGLGALATTRGEVLPAVFSGLGIGRTLLKKGKERGFLMEHFTAPRAYSAQYAISAAIAPNAEIAAAFLVWSWAFSRFDRKLNSELVEKVQNHFDPK